MSLAFGTALPMGGHLPNLEAGADNLSSSGKEIGSPGPAGVDRSIW